LGRNTQLRTCISLVIFSCFRNTTDMIISKNKTKMPIFTIIILFEGLSFQNTLIRNYYALLILPNILEHTNRVSVVIMDIWLIIIRKILYASGDKERLRRLINAKLKWKKTKNMRKKRQRTFQSKWLVHYDWMLIVSHIAISGGNILMLPIRNRECLLAKSWRVIYRWS
jgi:hypothetical protein